MALSGQFFNATYYLTQYADVAANWSGSALAHYEGYGAAEGRAPSSWFDYQYYRANAEAAIQAMTALEAFAHYEQYGYAEGRVTDEAYKNFDSAQYLADYSDLGEGGITGNTALNHYMVYGSAEGRVAKDTNGNIISGGSAAGETFTLTSGADQADTTGSSKNGGLVASTFKFTTANETVTAVSGTLTAGDVLADGSSADKDVLNATMSGGAAIAASITNIETINMSILGAGSGLNMASVTGATKVGISGSLAGTITGLAAATNQPTIAFESYAGTFTLTNTTFAGTTAAGTAETVNLEVSGGTTKTIVNLAPTAAGVLETLNLSSAGSAANTLVLANAAGTSSIDTLNVTGTQDLNLAMAHALISGASIKAADFDKTFAVTLDRHGATTAATNLTNVEGLEALIIQDSTAGVDTAVVTNVALGASVTVAMDSAGAAVIGVKGATGSDDSLSLSLDHITASTDVDIATSLTINNIETLNIASNGAAASGTSAQNSIAALTGDSFKAINIEGDSALSVTLANNASNYAIDGSKATKALTINAKAEAGSASAASRTISITTGEGADTVNMAAGNAAVKNTISTGAGKDTIVQYNEITGTSSVTGGDGTDTFSVGLQGGGGTTFAGAMTITDFTAGSGGDILQTNNDTVTIIAALANGNFASGTAAAIVAADNTTHVITDTAYATFNLAEAAIEAKNANTDDYLLAFLNSATGYVEVWADADSGVAGSGQKVATFENITTLTGIAKLTTDNFAVV